MQTAPQPPYDKVFYVCVNERPPGEDSCAPRGSVDIARELKARIKSMGLSYKVRVSRALCLGLCSMGPNLAVFPDNAWYHGVRMQDLDDILRKHLAVPGAES